jgi:lipopolysaccharide transport system permease protein
MRINPSESAGALGPSGVTDSTPVTTVQPLPGEPLVVIQPSKAWSALNLGEIWAYRELLYFLAWRDVKVRYKQTALGVAWIVMQPLLTTLVFTVFLGALARVPSDGNVPYLLFVFAGLLPWTFFSSSVQGSGNSLVGSAHLITKVYFPRLIIPGAATAGRLVDFAVSVVVLVGLMLFYRVAPGWGALLLPGLVALLALLALGIGMWASAVNVKYRDVGAVLPVIIQLLMFASPVVYPSHLVPERWRWLYELNPLVGLLEGFRSALFDRPFNWRALSISAVFTLALLVYSAYTFRRMEKGFADVV